MVDDISKKEQGVRQACDEMNNLVTCFAQHRHEGAVSKTITCIHKTPIC